MQLIFFSGVLNQLQNWILRESIFSYGSQWSARALISQRHVYFEGFEFLVHVHKDVLVIKKKSKVALDLINCINNMS